MPKRHVEIVIQRQQQLAVVVLVGSASQHRLRSPRRAITVPVVHDLYLLDQAIGTQA